MNPEKVRKKYEKLKKKYPLPEWRDLLLIGFFDEEDVESIFDLAKAVKKSIMDLQSMFQTLVVPQDFISMYDQKFLKDMRNELIKALTKTAYLIRYFSAKTVEAVKSENTEEMLANLINEVVEQSKEIMEVYYKAVKKLEEKWKDVEIENQEVNYQW